MCLYIWLDSIFWTMWLIFFGVQAMLEDVSESSMDSVIFQDDMADGSLSPLYTTQHSGIVVVNDGTLVFGEAERSGSGRTNPSPTQPGKGTCLCSFSSFLFVCLRCFYCCVFIICSFYYCVFIICYFCYLYKCQYWFKYSFMLKWPWKDVSWTVKSRDFTNQLLLLMCVYHCLVLRWLLSVWKLYWCAPWSLWNSLFTQVSGYRLLIHPSPFV